MSEVPLYGGPMRGAVPYERGGGRAPSSFARLNVGSALLVIKQNLAYKLSVRLRLTLFNDERRFKNNYLAEL